MPPTRVVPLAIVSPVRDEGKYVRNTLDAMVAQTVQPQEWLFVDDGSTDDTRAIIETYAAKHPWIRVISRDDRGFRQLGSGVIAAFDYGRARLARQDYQYIAKLDGDMSFTPRYLEVMIDRLEIRAEARGRLGQGVPAGERRISSRNTSSTKWSPGSSSSTSGSRSRRIGGFTQTILWDGIDIHRCRMKGYTTLSFHHPDAKLIHHRLMGSSDSNVFKGRVRLGRGIWFMGYHPLYAIASGLFRMHEKPYVIGGLIIIGSYFYAAVRREPRFDDPGFIRELQAWQLHQLWMLPARWIRRKS